MSYGNCLSPKFDPARFWTLVMLALANLSDRDFRDRAEQAIDRPGLWLVPGERWIRIDWPRGRLLTVIYCDLLASGLR